MEKIKKWGEFNKNKNQNYKKSPSQKYFFHKSQIWKSHFPPALFPFWNIIPFFGIVRLYVFYIYQQSI